MVSEGGWFPPRPVRKVLLLDDDAVTLQHWARMCTRLGKTPLVADTSAKAFELAFSARPDTAVIDFFLGGGEKASDVVPRLRALAPDLYIAVVSGKLFLAADALAALVRAGAHDCLPKYVGLDQLIRGIEAGVRPAVPDSDALMTREQVEHMVLEHALRACDYNITRTADTLRVTRSTIRSWIAKHGIEIPARKLEKKLGNRSGAPDRFELHAG